MISPTLLLDESGLAPNTHVLPFPWNMVKRRVNRSRTSAASIHPSRTSIRPRHFSVSSSSTSFHPQHRPPSTFIPSRVVGLTGLHYLPTYCTYVCSTNYHRKSASMKLDAHVTNILLQMDALVSHACSNINIARQPYEAESKRIPLSTVLQP